jgi:2-keto-4-pentenoate hydratase/2-oxohepta-3-ene-1,7-dioic acid hydratase in catechol pathway
LRLCNLLRDERLSLGVRTRHGVLDVEAAARAHAVAAPATTDEVVRGNHLPSLHALVARCEQDGSFHHREEEVTFGPCVASPQKLLMVGMNYRQHCAEIGQPIPQTPVLFNKYANALLGHRGTIRLPAAVASQFDHEVELVVVMGRRARDLSEAEALGAVFGYCTGNDFSARDLQFNTSQFMLGKTCDGFGPAGPWLVSADEVRDPQDLALTCKVNGELRQSSRTSDMVFGCAALVSFASRHMTLEPGDLLFTGTPSGVIQGRPEKDRTWLKAGDVVACEVEGLGELVVTLA